MKKVVSVIFTVLILTLLVYPASASELPAWYPEDVNTFEDFHGTDLPHVVDDARIFTASEEAEFSSRIERIIDKYGYDLVIFTDVTNYGIKEEVYPVDFYRFNGYGKGDDLSGSVFFICTEPGNRYWWSAGTGDAEKYYTVENVNDLDDRIEPYMREENFAEAVRLYLDSIDELYANGHLEAPARERTASDYLGAGAVSSIVGLIVGLVVSGKEKAKMYNVRYAAYANDYIVNNSFRMKDLREMFLYKNVTRSVIESSSGSGGRSGGGSSHSSGYHSSGGGGHSFSGGGRHF